ncbi:MAG: CBS domain-containing protein [Bacterioplanes sp.]|nr:CBS domain-containing protein [Bacterioplanes sp.]
MKTVSDIMTRNPHTLTPQASLLDAEQLMKTHQIRHLPIANDEQQVQGVISQKEVLAEAFKITNRFGSQHLQSYLAKTLIDQAMQREVITISPDMPLLDAGRLLQEKKRGCLLVTNGDNQLQGILTSQDFVKLAIQLLDQ